MSDICKNEIRIIGSSKFIHSLWGKATREGGGLLSAMVPPPENIYTGKLGSEERQNCLDNNIPNWYDWRCQHWGTKWDCDMNDLSITDNRDGTSEITGGFETAWCPPLEAYKTFCLNNPDIIIQANYTLFNGPDDTEFKIWDSGIWKDLVYPFEGKSKPKRVAKPAPVIDSEWLEKHRDDIPF